MSDVTSTEMKVMAFRESDLFDEASDEKTSSGLKESRRGLKRESSRNIWVRASNLREFFCSSDLAYRCTKAGWLIPVIKGKRRTIYRVADVIACMERIEAGELPPPRRP